jgi:hypothetical protein
MNSNSGIGMEMGREAGGEYIFSLNNSCNEVHRKLSTKILRKYEELFYLVQVRVPAREFGSVECQELQDSSSCSYRADIGNISTSHMKVKDDIVKLDLRPRFFSL